jgi:hypothetical protein
MRMSRGSQENEWRLEITKDGWWYCNRAESQLGRAKGLKRLVSVDVLKKERLKYAT